MRPGPEWFILVETIGMISFAVNAMIVAAGKKLSTLGIFVCVVAASFGGGTLRDLLLGPAAQPFFWIKHPFYIVSIFALTIGYANIALVRTLICRRDFLIKETAEAIALASFGGLGAVKAFNILEPGIGAGFWSTAQLWILSAFFGAMSAAFGAILRDVLVNDFPVTLRPGSWSLEAAFIGSAVIIALRLGHIPEPWALLVGFCVMLVLRLWTVFGGRALQLARASIDRNT